MREEWKGSSKVQNKKPSTPRYNAGIKQKNTKQSRSLSKVVHEKVEGKIRKC